MVTLQRPGSPVHSVRLSDQVTRALVGRIVNGEIGESAPPPTEQEICRDLEVDLAFHRALAAATDNVVLGFLLDSVRELLRVSRRITNLTGALADATQAHRQILDAVAAGESETARQAMRSHLLTVTSVWAPGEDRPELQAAIGRGKDDEREAVNV